MTDAEAIGRKVIAALDVGRRIAIEASQQRSAGLRRVIAQLAADDAARGKPARGRAGRIARKLDGLSSERRVLQILSETQSSVSDSLCNDACNEAEVNHIAGRRTR